MLEQPNDECVCGHRRSDHPDNGACVFNDKPEHMRGPGHPRGQDCDEFRPKREMMGFSRGDNFDADYREPRDWE